MLVYKRLRKKRKGPHSGMPSLESMRDGVHDLRLEGSPPGFQIDGFVDERREFAMAYMAAEIPKSKFANLSDSIESCNRSCDEWD